MLKNKIPDGLKVKKVSELGKVVTGSTPPMSDKSNYNGNFPWVTAQDFKGKYIYDSVIKLSDKGKKLSRIIPAGSILVTCIASIGLNAIAGVDMATNQQINSIIPNENTNGEFLYYLIDNNADYLKIFAGAGGMLILSKSEFEKIKFTVPPLSEQKKIAEILSAWDKAIELLDRKIDLKSQQKKYLMQTLLTGDTRLSGFSAPWREVKLGDILKNISKRNNIGIKRVLSISNKFGFILPEEYFSKYISSKDLSNYKIISKNEFAYNPARINVGSIAKLTDYNNGVLSPMYVIFKCVDIHTDYFYHWLKTYEFNKKVCLCSQGSVRETVDFNSLSSIKIKIPTDIKEQEKIAEILTLADEGISLLKKKRELVKQQKKYLMQTLLTGQIRVSV